MDLVRRWETKANERLVDFFSSTRFRSNGNEICVKKSRWLKNWFSILRQVALVVAAVKRCFWVVVRRTGCRRVEEQKVSFFSGMLLVQVATFTWQSLRVSCENRYFDWWTFRFEYFWIKITTLFTLKLRVHHSEIAGIETHKIIHRHPCLSESEKLSESLNS